MHSMGEEARAAQLRGFEAVAAITLVPEPFTVENGLLTPTFKLKRPVAKETYQALIESMYDSLAVGDSTTAPLNNGGGAGSMAGKPGV